MERKNTGGIETHLAEEQIAKRRQGGPGGAEVSDGTAHGVAQRRAQRLVPASEQLHVAQHRLEGGGGVSLCESVCLCLCLLPFLFLCMCVQVCLVYEPRATHSLPGSA